MMAIEQQAAGGAKLERELAVLLEIERFEPPPAFREQALLKDPAVYERAARDPQGWWVEQAEQLHWFRPWESVLDDSNPPFYEWFTGGTLNASYNCLDRHVEAGLGDRVAFHWRGEEGEERELTYAQLLAEVERLASALKALGIAKGDVVGIYLPMIPVRGGRARAHGVLAGQGPDHRRRGGAQGQDRCGEGSRRRGHGRPGDPSEDRGRAQQGHAVPDARGSRRLLRRDPGHGCAALPGGAA